jgi:hypothetical protein
MVEYHVDSYHGFQEKMDKETEFGGKLNVRIRNESWQKKAWTLPMGETTRVKISAFQSRGFGFVMPLTEK